MGTNVLKLDFNCNNKMLTMAKTSDFKVIKIEGLEASAYSIGTINSNQDGAIITHKKINPREIKITGDVKKNENEDINRQLLISFFNPKYDGELRIKRNSVERKINYSVSDFRFINTKMNEWLQFELVLECVNPYFSSVDNFGNDVASVSKMFAFPLVICPTKIMGYKTFNNNVVLKNDGDCETGVEIHIKCAGDKIENPKISLNDKFIELKVSMVRGDILIINTNQRKKSITLNGQNIIQKIDRKSSFFSLDIGTNVLEYTADDGYVNMEVYVYFNKAYLGV